MNRAAIVGSLATHRVGAEESGGLSKPACVIVASLVGGALYGPVGSALPIVVYVIPLLIPVIEGDAVGAVKR